MTRPLCLRRVTMTVPQYRRRYCTLWSASPSTPTAAGGGFRQRLDPQQAEVLALLLVARPDRWVTIDTIIDDLWPGDDPLTADKIVQVRICQLRRFGVQIANARGFGYRIPACGRAAGLPLADQRIAA